tara:strand:+ start:5968 stop:6429 length:462 start_codon:yes stop_codon:yes gene_type:complete
MATKWHPASGKWGIFGETQGSKQARKNTGALKDMVGTVESRIPQVKQYYSEIGNIQDQIVESHQLTALDEFLNQSYSINMESDEKIARTNFATAEDVSGERKKDYLTDTYKRKKDVMDLSNQLDIINRGQKEKQDVFAMEDLINQLKIEIGRN